MRLVQVGTGGDEEVLAETGLTGVLGVFSFRLVTLISLAW